jgi:hypothetical protein
MFLLAGTFLPQTRALRGKLDGLLFNLSLSDGPTMKTNPARVFKTKKDAR